jgi:hypothetical protein
MRCGQGQTLTLETLLRSHVHTAFLWNASVEFCPHNYTLLLIGIRASTDQDGGHTHTAIDGHMWNARRDIQVIPGLRYRLLLEIITGP